MFTLVCKIDCDVVYISSHFPPSRLDFRGSFIGLTASSSLAIYLDKNCTNQEQNCNWSWKNWPQFYWEKINHKNQHHYLSKLEFHRLM